MGSYAEPLSAYLDRLRGQADLSLEEIAKASGYRGRSSVQRYFDKDENIKEVRKDVAARIARALIGRGTPPITLRDLARLAGFEGELAQSVSDTTIASALKLSVASDLSKLSYVAPLPVRGIRIVGSSHASYWMPSAPSLDTAIGWLEVPFLHEEIRDQYALLIKGPSINRVAPEGHYAICKRFDGSTTNAPEGKFVHVERLRNGEAEWTVKRARWTADGFALWPDSDDADFQAPLLLGDGDDEVAIKGIVVGWYKPA